VQDQQILAHLPRPACAWPSERTVRPLPVSRGPSPSLIRDRTLFERNSTAVGSQIASKSSARFFASVSWCSPKRGTGSPRYPKVRAILDSKSMIGMLSGACLRFLGASKPWPKVSVAHAARETPGIMDYASRPLQEEAKCPEGLIHRLKFVAQLADSERMAAPHSAAVSAPTGTTSIGGACDSARSSAGPTCRLKLSAQLIRPT
jgi:hypothetical protein